MVKKEFVKLISDKNDITQKQAEQVFDSIFEEISNLLVTGDSLSITNFGSFKVKNKKARKGRNPKTGESLTIPAHKAVKFKISNTLKNNVK